MITSYKENGCAIYVERHAMSDTDIRAFMEKCPIRCVFYDKDNESLKRLSSLDGITNKFDFKRTYNARTYITFRLTVSNGEIVIDEDSADGNEVGMIAVSKRYIRTYVPSLRRALNEKVKERAMDMCMEFINESLRSLLDGKCYSVKLLQDDVEQRMDFICVDNIVSLQKYIASNIKLSDPSFKKLIMSIK